MKKCFCCEETKPKKEFCKLTKSKDGLYYYCRECDNKKHEEYKKENHVKVTTQKRECALIRKYGITIKEFDKMIENQFHKCPICNRDFREKIKPVVDHCHKTGKIRGILCYGCNVSIGQFQESKEIFINAMNYLGI